MAFLHDRNFIVDGKAALVLSGEVHYFRLKRSEWGDRLRKAKDSGCNAVASYIPWMFHEESEGQIDVIGRTRPERDLGAFIDLCKAEGLWFLARPGPFVMGEVKNEGIPDWIYAKCPHAIPITWEGKRATSKTLSYLNPEFLVFVNRWYHSVGKVLASRLEPIGGNVIAMQLDNEIGMLQCWTEEADLSEEVLCEFVEWVQKHRSSEEIAKSYGIDLGDPFARTKSLRDGHFKGALRFHADYTGFTRDRFSRYVLKLREFAVDSGVVGIPYIVNIHGSGGGKATTFPIGISQTYRAYTQLDDLWGASDFYLGELTRENLPDLYFLNAFMACVNRPNQPLASMEFEAGTGDYGENGAVRQTGAATDFKARLCVVQGNRMLNHYLLAGGRNPMLDHPKKDGNGRLGTTGERHGFAAPISPEGELDPTYFALKDTNLTLKAVASQLVKMEEEHDSIALGFIPDYYSTDVKPAGPMRELAVKLEAARGPLTSLVRSMLECGLSFPAVNLQESIPPAIKAIAFSSSTCMSSETQRLLLDFVKQGGNLLFVGELPLEDFQGRPATQLREALGIKFHPTIAGSSDYFPSIMGVGWASHEPEVRVWQIATFESEKGEPFLKLNQTDRLAGAIFHHGKGKVAFTSVEFPMHLSLWRGLLSQLGVKPAVAHDYPHGGIVLSRVRDSEGHRFISLMNLDGDDKEFHVREGQELLFGGSVSLVGHKAKLLPINLNVGGIPIKWSTAEIADSGPGIFSLRQSVVTERLLTSYQLKFDPANARSHRHENGDFVYEIFPGKWKVTFSK